MRGLIILIIIGLFSNVAQAQTPINPVFNNVTITGSLIGVGVAIGNIGYTPLNPTNNLSDVSSIPLARSNLLPAGTVTAGMLASGAVLSNLGYTPLNPANNLSDVANTPTALFNLGFPAVTLITSTGSMLVTSAQTYITWNPITPATTSFTLPSAPSLGEEHTFKDQISSGTFSMSVVSNAGQNIDGHAYWVLAYANDSIEVKYAGSNSWVIVH